MATTLFGSGAPLWLALATALIVNARMFIYSTSIAPVLSDAPGWLRPLLGHMLVDQNYASTMTKGRFRDDVDVIPYYIGAWLALASVWQLSTLAGRAARPAHPAVVGTRLRGAARLPRDARARRSRTRTAVSVCVVTAVASAVLVPLLPMQTGLVVAILAGMLYGAWLDRPSAG